MTFYAFIVLLVGVHILINNDLLNDTTSVLFIFNIFILYGYSCTLLICLFFVLSEKVSHAQMSYSGFLFLLFLQQEQVVEAPPEPEALIAPSLPTTNPPALEDADLTWEDKEDEDKKLDTEKTQPLSPKSSADKKYQYKEGRCCPLSTLLSQHVH